MIRIVVKDEFWRYDVYHLAKAFYPNEQIETQWSAKESGDSLKAENDWALRLYYQEEQLKITILECEVRERILLGAKEEVLPKEQDEKREYKYALKCILYLELAKMAEKTLEWGMLIGVRPTKIPMKELSRRRAYYTGEPQELEKEVMLWLEKHYFISKEKAKLAVEIALQEEALMETIDLKEGYSLYIGIPFCPTRCSYCSFTAYPLDQWENRIDEYLDSVCKELEFLGHSVGKHGSKETKHLVPERKLNAIYIGGGTPTTLTPVQLDRVLTCLEENFSYEDLQEITVEAGRPDTITIEKLKVLKNHNVGRISINPQTMQGKTLERIGRKHSIEEIYQGYQWARELGFDNINMDLIVGLPGESVEDVEDTLKKIMELNPDSLTVHALAMKRSSHMTLSGTQIQEGADIEEMIRLSAEYAGKMELEPYYLYRQKNMAGNYENVGYAKVDKAGIYNILIMEEKQSIIAVGAGATTKIVRPKEKNRIRRIENVKNVEAYMERIEEMIARKEEGLWH